MTLKVRIIREALKKKGFVEDTSGHHVYFWFYFQDRMSAIRTWVSHGETEIDNWLIGKMAKQLHLSKSDFLRLVSCDMDGDEYRDLMLEEGHLVG